MITSFTSVVKQEDQQGIFSELNDPSIGETQKSAHNSMGTGLELTLVQRFVELHGGDVQIKSPQGKGTTITCRIPVSGKRNNDQPNFNLASG